MICNDDGSVLPLVLGYVALALAAILVCVCATDLYIAQKRLDSVADAAALAGSYGFTLAADGAGATATLTNDDVWEQASAVVAVAGSGAELVAASAPDGASARVSVATTWHPPMFALFVPEGVQLQATATSRTALQ